MFIRIIAFLGLVTLSASAQTPPKKPQTASGELCGQVAAAAFEANHDLSVRNTTGARSAPFVGAWLVQETLGSRSGVDRSIEARTPAEVDLDENYIRWTDDVGLLPHQGQFLTVNASHELTSYNRSGPTGAFLKSVIGKDGIMCAFDNRVHERRLPEAGETETACDALLSDGSTVLTPDRELPATTKTFSVQRPLETAQGFAELYEMASYSLGKYLKADVDGDGTEETLVQIDWAGPGGRCVKKFYDVLDPTNLNTFSKSPVRALVRDAQRTIGPEGVSCSLETRIRKKDGHVFFEVSGLEQIVRRGEPIITKGSGPLERTLTAIIRGKTQRLCTTTFSIEPVVRWAR